LRVQGDGSVDDLVHSGGTLARRAFSCQEDAETAAGAWLQRAGYHRLMGGWRASWPAG